MISVGLRTGVERLVTNLALRHGISRDRAIFMVESVLHDLKRPSPTPPEPPTVEKERRVA